jgi:hypothetical protein
MANMPAVAGGSLTSDSSITADETAPESNVAKGKSCICGWCSGRASLEHPVKRIPVQTSTNKSEWKKELRMLLEYLRRDEQYIDGVIREYEAASVPPPIVEGQTRLPKQQLNYFVHHFHFLKVVAGGGGRSAIFTPFNSLAAIIAGDPLFDQSKPVFHAMLREDVAAKMQNIAPKVTLAFVAQEQRLAKRK